MPGAYPTTPSLLQSLPSASDPDAITEATLAKMVRIVRKYKSDAGTVMAARRITSNVPERASRGIVEALQTWVRDRIRYVNDPRGLEMVQTPPQTLSILTGDCDDKATLLATLLETMGYATRFAAIGENNEPFFSHVMAQVRLGNRWVNLETILPGAAAGWFPQDATAWKFYHV